jgi:methyltransferase (TIGR00027 family)
MSGLTSPLPKTALGVALARAAESQRADRLFDDPYAELFLAAAPHVFDEEIRLDRELTRAGVSFVNMVAVRTRFYDDYLLDACRGGCRQVVLLAAGLDSRAFRLDWPTGTRLFELDLPEVIDFKDEVLANAEAVPRCERVVLAADLLQDWTPCLVYAGLDSEQPTAWLVEGLLRYLSPDEAMRLLASVGALSAPDSRLSCNYETGVVSTDPAEHKQIMAEFTSLRKGGLGEDTPTWLSRHGWTVETRERADIADSYGRGMKERRTGAFLIATRL